MPVPQRDVAIVLAGGHVNGAFTATGFLKRLRESSLWPRVGTIFATSSGGLVGTFAALDRLDDLEKFLLGLQPSDIFRPRPLFAVLFRGPQEFVLPATVVKRVGPLEHLAEELSIASRELVVIVTDIGGAAQESRQIQRFPLRQFEVAYSSRTTSPQVMANAIFASAAIPGYVEPIVVDGVIGVDGGWVRNYPLAHAFERLEVSTIVSCSHRSGVSTPKGDGFVASALKPALPFLKPFRYVPGIGTLVGELEQALERRQRGFPVDLTDVLLRLGSITITRNMAFEDVLADEKDRSVDALFALEHDVRTMARASGGDGNLDSAIAARFLAADFAFRHDRKLERFEVCVTPPRGIDLDPGPRRLRPWRMEEKRALIARGYALTDQALRTRGIR